MPDVTASDALRYATEDAMLTLYAVVLAGWLLLLVSQFAAARAGMVQFLGLLGVVLGAFVLLAGLVATAYKLLVDARRV